MKNSVITISGGDEALLRKVERFAQSLGLKVQFRKSAHEAGLVNEPPEQHTALKAMTALAALKPFKDINIRVNWQQSQRTDRPLQPMQSVLLDSNIIIALAQGKIDHNQLHPYTFLVSDIQRLEVMGYHKITPQELSLLEQFFNHVRVIPIDSEVMADAIVIRRSLNMSVGDSIIAATCRVHHLTLLTANVKDFVKVEKLEIVNPM